MNKNFKNIKKRNSNNEILEFNKKINTNNYLF